MQPTQEDTTPASNSSTATSCALVSTVVDEQTPIVLLARMQPPGSTLYLEAGAGSGKTSCAESVINVSKKDHAGNRVQLVATTMTRAGVNEMKSRAGIPDHMVKSLHSLGFSAICKAYSQRMGKSLKKHGLQDQVQKVRLPKPHPTKYQIMAQILLPATALDKEPFMHVPDCISGAYKLLVDFIEQLATKAMEGGLGQPGNPDVSDLKALRRLVDRYELEPLIERAYNELTFELWPIVEKSVAIILRFGGEALSEPAADVEAMAHSLTLPLLAGTPAARLQAGMVVTGVLLGETVKVAMRPAWRGMNVITNALNPKDVMFLPSVSFVEMVALPSNVAVMAPVLARNGSKYDFILVDEAQDSNMAQSGLIKWAMARHTQLIVIADPKQRCYSFASASASALLVLLAPREIGVVDRRELKNNYRCARLICKEVQSVLNEMQCDRAIRPVRPDDGEVIRHASLRRGELQAWMAEGSVAILARLNSVLACFKAHFLKVGQPFAVLGQEGVLPQLLRLLETFDAKATLSTMVLDLRGLATSANKLSLEDKDIALCLAIFASSLLPELYSGPASAKRRVAQLLEKAYKGSAIAAGNAALRGMPIIANGHGAKGHEFDTVLLAEPSLIVIQKIVDGGGEEAEDELHLKYVLTSRAKNRLVYLEDTFKTHGALGIADLCTPM
tara:strand:- start:208 stop:2229 length:2022 start_codon:yes stop_codon:yes gene_type:complete